MPGYGAVPVGNKKALWSMILGILACTICCGFVGVVLGIVGLVIGNQAKAEIAASGGMQTGEGQAKAGVILGAVAIALGIIVTLLYVTLIVSSN
jgi:Flp pilus assembly protein protease CpaA